MKTLILVDLDNVLKGDRTRWELPKPEVYDAVVEWSPAVKTSAEFVRRGGPELDEDGAVVVIAFNQDTACSRLRVPLRAAYLLSLAEHSARKVGVKGKVLVEPILVASVPQAADFALLTAITEAPERSVSGPFQRVVLFTDDHGLRGAVASRLPLPSVSKPFPRFRSDPFPAGEWTLVRELTRRHPTQPRAAKEPGVAPSGWSARVERPEHAAAVAGHSLRWDPALEFSTFAAGNGLRVEQRTILGPTSHTQRGVARLGELAASAASGPTIGAVDPSDGLEVEGPGPFKPCTPTVVAPASIGGAVRFSEARVTLATHLPHEVFPYAVSAGCISLHAAVIDPTAVLAFSARKLVSMGGASLTVRASRPGNGPELKFEVLADGVTPRLRGWWSHESPPAGQRRAQSELRVPRIPRLSLNVNASGARGEAVVTAVDGKRVDITAPALNQMKVQAMTTGWEIVVGSSGARRAFVLLPPGRPSGWRPNKPFTLDVKRIQLLPVPPDWWTEPVPWWALWVRAPLLVPCQWDATASVSEARDGP